MLLSNNSLIDVVASDTNNDDVVYCQTENVNKNLTRTVAASVKFTALAFSCENLVVIIKLLFIVYYM